jgi:uncharacterized membrane protein YesL
MAATAAMYVVAQQIAQGELVSARDAWQALRRLFWPALGWGALNLLIAAAVCVNFAVYGNLPGLGWAALRLAWGAIALLWFALNLFYWPFWLAQHDRRLAITYRNALLLYLKAPGFGLTLMVVCAALILVSVAITLPLAVALMAWLALIGVLAVEAALRRPQAGEGAALADAGVELDAL